jgi:hypothetical protein
MWEKTWWFFHNSLHLTHSLSLHLYVDDATWVLTDDATWVFKIKLLLWVEMLWFCIQDLGACPAAQKLEVLNFKRGWSKILLLRRCPHQQPLAF